MEAIAAIGSLFAGEAAATAVASEALASAAVFEAGTAAAGTLGGMGSLGGLASAGYGAGLTAAGTSFATEGLLGAAGAAGAGGLGQTLLKSGAEGAAGAVASSLLQPKMPGLPKPVRMPDPLGTEEARKKSIIEQTARRGRAASILTEPAGSDRLGGLDGRQEAQGRCRPSLQQERPAELAASGD